MMCLGRVGRGKGGVCAAGALTCLVRRVLLRLPRFYGVLLGSVCILYLLPLCWVMAILNSTLFLGNPQFYQGESPPWRRSAWGGLGEGPLRLGSLPSSSRSAPVRGSAWDLCPAQRLPTGV